MTYLTKSLFKLGLECPTKMYYYKNNYYSLKDSDEFLQALAEGGFQVGELAKLYYPGGHDITDSGHDEPLKKTTELLNQENVIIFEAAIKHENMFIRIDILKKEGNKLRLIEVKAKSFENGKTEFENKNGEIKPEWKPYIHDIAFQKYVLSKAYPGFEIDCYLMLADKSKVATVDGLNQKFQIVTDKDNKKSIEIIDDKSSESLGEKILTEVNVNDYIEKVFKSTFKIDMSFEDLINYYAKAVENKTKIQASIGAYCGSCEYRTKHETKSSGFEECWDNQKTKLPDYDKEKPLIFDLWNYRNKQKLIDKDVIYIVDIDNETFGEIKSKGDGKLSVSERQLKQIEKVKNNDNSAYINFVGLKNELDKHIYPLHFIDFETSMVAIPFYNGCSPYEQIAFQYSHHIMEKNGTIRHESQFLYTEKGKFPNFEFIRKLKETLEKDDGTIFRYADHENTVLNQIKKQLLKRTDTEVKDRDELIEFIDSITHDNATKHKGKRDMVDMCQIVKDYYYDPYTNGSNSIKAVLPAVLNRSEYIQDKYSKDIYGKGCEISSLNFEEPQVWIQKDEQGKIKSPYELLPNIFSDISEEELGRLSISDSITDGGSALVAFAKMQFTNISDNEKKCIENGLLRYCELDTLAMVIIYEYWLNEVKK